MPGVQTQPLGRQTSPPQPPGNTVNGRAVRLLLECILVISDSYLQVLVEQKAVLYQSTHDWFCYKTVHEEVFDNHDDSCATWSFNENISTESNAQWTLIKALKSSKVLPLRLSLEYPVNSPGQETLKVEFDCTRLSPATTSQSASRPATLRVSHDVTVDAYSTSKVFAQLRVGQTLPIQSNFRFKGH